MVEGTSGARNCLASWYAGCNADQRGTAVRSQIRPATSAGCGRACSVVAVAVAAVAAITCDDHRASGGKRSARRDGRAQTEFRRATVRRCRRRAAAATARRKVRTHPSRPRSAVAPDGAVICVAEGTYPEQIRPGEKVVHACRRLPTRPDFKVRDSAAYVSKATGRGGSFIRIEDPGPKGNQLTAIDGFDISGYSQAIVPRLL